MRTGGGIRRLATLLAAVFCSVSALGQGRVLSGDIRTLRVTLDGNPLLAPVLKLGGSSHLFISWDEMSHDYHRYTYRLQHCSMEWQPTEDLFESDYLYGTNDLPVDQYENSFNTTQIYTHYSLQFPNRDASPLLSGNYTLSIYDEDAPTDGEAVIEVRFRVVEESMGLTMAVSSNTDVDCNVSHQQVTLDLDYGGLSVVTPQEQITALVMQNRRESRSVTGTPADIVRSSGLQWLHRDELIFPAGNEYHKFEILNVHQSGMNVDNMRWYDPFFHATLWTDVLPENYLSAEDHNGIFIPRTEDQENNDTQSEYVMVHFSLEIPRQQEGIYVSGQWSNGELDPDCQMTYNEAEERYEAEILLKQGYYEYIYVGESGSVQDTMGDFWQTENEYQAFIYYRELGGRYDRIVAHRTANLR